MRLIDADALLKDIEREYNNHYPTDRDIMDCVRYADTINPVEHGHIVWRERERENTKYEKGRCLKCGKDTVVELAYPDTEKIPYCSKCGKRVGDTSWSFCPNCGVRLDGEEEFVGIGEG